MFKELYRSSKEMYLKSGYGNRKIALAVILLAAGFQAGRWLYRLLNN